MDPFTITFLLAALVVSVFALAIAILALPGPKRPGHKKS